MFKKNIVFLIVSILLVSMVGTLGGATNPKYGGTLKYAVQNEPRSLFPANMLGAGEGDVFTYAYEGLVQFNEEGKIVSQLAKDWDVSEDGTVYTFHLHEDVEFHDGTPFNAEAVKFVFEESIKKEYLISSLLSNLERINVVNNYTVELVYGGPVAGALSNLAYFSMAMWSPTAYKENGKEWMATNLVGTGPFEFVEWKHGDYVKFEKNENYWQSGLPYLDAVMIEIVPEPANRVMMLQKGEIHRTKGIPPQYLPILEKDSNIKLKYQLDTSQTYLAFNTTVHPFDNPQVRRAIAYAIDKKGIIDSLLGDLAQLPRAPICTIGMVGCRDVSEPGDETINPYNPEKAKKLLKFGGFEDRDDDGVLEDPKGSDFKFTLWVPTERVAQSTSVAQYVQKNLEDIGVQVKLRLWEYGAMSSMVGVGPEKAQYSAFLRGWGSPTNDVDEIMMNLFHSRSWKPQGSNRMFYGNLEVDRLAELTHVEANPEKRNEIAKQVLKIVVEDAPIFPLHSLKKVVAETTNVENSKVLPIFGQNPANFAWLETGE